ncbi:hypothetical protein SADUNF_Sadunf05G0132200 [Salix dunnii]|uniref:Uncharacterized protein n=1 Tax=Salix dunnii TaxID=1413687 RepID=A0A835K8E0_9ROSI|nr:hypothetical protein SADUNF_Sadunf05G0132200 [Salix dunnii]
MQERSNRPSVPVRGGQNTVPCTLISTIAKDLYLIASIDDNSVLHWLDINPLPIFENLEAAYLIILEEQDDTPSIGVGSEAID